MSLARLDRMLSAARQRQEEYEFLAQYRPRLASAEQEDQIVEVYRAVFDTATDADEQDLACRWTLGVAADQLGLFFKNRRFGDPVGNRRQALRYMGRALRYFDRDEHARDWAITNYNRANAFRLSRTGPRDAADLRAAIRHYEAALVVLEGLGDQLMVANLYDNLLGVCAELPDGDRLRNLLDALAWGEKAGRAYAAAAAAGLDELAFLGNFVHITLEVVLLVSRRFYLHDRSEGGVNREKLEAQAVAAWERAAGLLARLPDHPSLIQLVDRVGFQVTRWAREYNAQHYSAAVSWRASAVDLHAALVTMGFALPQTGCLFRNELARVSVDAAEHDRPPGNLDELVDAAVDAARQAYEPEYLAAALFIRIQRRLLNGVTADIMDVCVAEARDALTLLPPDSNFDPVADEFTLLVSAAAATSGVDRRWAAHLGETCRGVRSRWEPPSLGWFHLARAEIGLRLCVVRPGDPPAEAVEAVREAQQAIEDLQPYISPLFNRTLWAEMHVGCLETLSNCGVTEPPDDLLRYSGYAFTIHLVPVVSELDSMMAEYHSAEDLAPPLDRRARLKSIAESLGLDWDFPEDNPAFALAPRMLDSAQLDVLAERLRAVQL